jgi:predicted nucleotidyltransferase
MTQNRVSIGLEIVLALLKASAHGRAISKLISQPLTNVQRSIRELESKNALKYRSEGKNKIYSLKDSLQARSIIFMAENYKLMKMISKYPYLEPIIKDILVATTEPVILFGSHAKGLAKQDSDIDIFIETKDLKIKENIENINSRISAKIGKLSKTDLLSKEIIAHHVILRGFEQYYEQFPWKD